MHRNKNLLPPPIDRSKLTERERVQLTVLELAKEITELNMRLAGIGATSLTHEGREEKYAVLYNQRKEKLEDLGRLRTLAVEKGWIKE